MLKQHSSNTILSLSVIILTEINNSTANQNTCVYVWLFTNGLSHHVAASPPLSGISKYNKDNRKNDSSCASFQYFSCLDVPDDGQEAETCSIKPKYVAKCCG